MIKVYSVLFGSLAFLQSFAQTKDSSHIDLSLNKISPREFVSYLKINRESLQDEKLLHVNGEVSSNWITYEEVKYLMNFIESQDASKCVWTNRSSVHPHYSSSTLGGQVMNLIDAYRLNKSYPFFLEDCSITDKVRVNEIHNWWNKLKK